MSPNYSFDFKLCYALIIIQASNLCVLSDDDSVVLEYVYVVQQ